MIEWLADYVFFYMWIIFWLDVKCDFVFVAYFRDCNQYCHALGHQFPILILHRKKTYEVNPKTRLVQPPFLPVKKLCVWRLRSPFVQRERNIRWRMAFQFDGSALLGKGGLEERKKTSGCEKRESTSALFKTDWRNGNIKWCVCDNGWMDVPDENYQCYDTKVMIRCQF